MVMINNTPMKYIRVAILALIATTMTSCQTWNGLKNSAPVRFLDEIGAEAMNLISDNGSPTGGGETLQIRGRQIQSRGIYAGQVPTAAAPRQSVVAR